MKPRPADVWFLLLSFGVLIFFLAVSDRGQASDTLQARVQDLTGSVEGYRETEGEWRVASKGEQYLDRDALSTGEASWVQLLFQNQHQLRMQENTELTIRQLFRRKDTGDEVTELELSSGEILNRVRRLPTSASIYTIHTPTATSSVRGTRFLVRVFQRDGEWVTEIQVLDGLVEVTDRVGQILEITDRQAAEISELGVPQHPRSMNRSERRALSQGFRALSATATEPQQLEMDANLLENYIQDQLLDLDMEINKPVEVDMDDKDDPGLF